MVTPPQSPSALRAKVRAALQAGDGQKALSIGRAMVRAPRSTVEDCLNVAELCDRLFDLPGALVAMRQAVRRAPGNAQILVQLARQEFFAGQTELAVKSLDRARTLATTGQEWEAIGDLDAYMGQAELAGQSYTRAVEIEPGRVSANESLAKNLSYLGLRDKSEAQYDRVIATGKAQGVSYYERSALRTQTDTANHIDELRTRIEAVEKGAGVAPYLNYALAKELEDVGDNPSAFTTMERAARQRRQSINFDVAASIAEIDAIIDMFDSSFMSARAGGDPTSEPIFVMGLPRSGTTLTERVIASHSDVLAAASCKILRGRSATRRRRLPWKRGCSAM
jgi:tetratricopeptide (TPR) repeat protein